MTYTKILNEKIIYAASEQILDCLRARGISNLKSEWRDYHYVGEWRKFLIKRGLKSKIKDSYDIDHHKNNREQYHGYITSAGSKQIEICQKLLQLALTSDNEYVRVSLEDIENVFYFLHNEMPEDYECERPLDFLFDSDHLDWKKCTHIIDDKTWKGFERSIKGKKPVNYYDEVYEK